jgi:ankyrin repeat protein
MARQGRSVAARACSLLVVAALGMPGGAFAQARPKKPKPRPPAAKASPANKAATEQLFAALNEFIPNLSDIDAALKAGADVNGLDEEGWTPLMRASKKMNENTIKALLAAKASVNLKTPRGATALMMACSENQWMVIPLLLEAGADVNAQDEAGGTPLWHCAIKAGSNAIEALLKAGANKDLAAKDGTTPLFVAIAEGNGQGARALFKAGSRVAPQAENGLPVLGLAVLSADPEAARVALKATSDVNVRSEKGHTPLMMAANFGYAEIVADLQRAKADTAIKDPEGKTALDFAKERGHTEVVAMLSGTWARPKLPGTTVSVPCDKLGGPVDVNLQTASDNLAVTITYPRPLSSILGGFYDEPGRYGYKETSASVGLYLDTDANPKTGAPGSAGEEASRGAEYELRFAEIGTSVDVPFGAEGQTKRVTGQVLSASFDKKGGSGPDPSAGDAFYPKSVNDGGVLKSEVPLAALGVKPGAKVRVVAEVQLCSRKEATLQLK